MAHTVIEALRRFLPGFLKVGICLNDAQRRALWAIQQCRTPTMGGHLHACEPCGTREFRFHSCNHRSCPQCGRADTKEWVRRQLDQRVGAPYFMVTFTLPAELRPLFFTPFAREIYRIFFEAAAHALRVSMGHRRSLRATTTGFTLVLHTWNQRLLFHPHLHAIVPGAGLDKNNRVITARRATFLAPKAVLRAAFSGAASNWERINWPKGLICRPLSHGSGTGTGASSSCLLATDKTPSNISAPTSAAPPLATPAFFPSPTPT
jgi:hypothetical protein